MALGVSPDGTSNWNAKLGVDCDMASGLDDVQGRVESGVGWSERGRREFKWNALD